MPEDVQEELYRSVVALENVEIVRPAYGVEYDHIDARELKGMIFDPLVLTLVYMEMVATLETKRIKVSPA